MTMWSDWMVVPWVLSVIGAVLFWMILLAIIVSSVEHHRHRTPHPRHHLR